MARSTFCYHQGRLQAPDTLETLKSEITDIFKKNHAPYGHRCIHTELAKQGWSVAKKTVLKLMRALGLVCKVRRKKRYSSYQGAQDSIAANVLNRKFDATAPNEKWVTDVTEFSVGDRPAAPSPHSPTRPPPSAPHSTPSPGACGVRKNNSGNQPPEKAESLTGQSPAYRAISRIMLRQRGDGELFSDTSRKSSSTTSGSSPSTH